MSRLMQRFSAVTVAIALAVLASTVEAQTVYSFDLPEQALAESLRAVGHRTSTNVMFEPRLVKDLQAPALRMEATLDEAVRLLLSGTRLNAVQMAPDSILIRGAWMSEDGVAEKRAGTKTSAVQGTGIKTPLAQSDGMPANQDSSGSGAEQNASEPATRPNVPKIEEVVVTAQKREEILQDVPIDITVLSGYQLDRSTYSSVDEALRAIPGLDTNAGGQYAGSGALISVRGVSNAAERAGGAGTVAFYIDGTPFGFIRNAFYPTSGGVYDLERIEFLAGPQGTLYGANALNGVVRYLTKKADPSQFELKTRVMGSATSGSEDMNYRGDLTVNLPLIEDKLAVRATIGHQDMAGWIDSPVERAVNHEDQQNYRVKLHARPTDTLSIDLSAWRQVVDGGAPNQSTDDKRITTTIKQSRFTQFDAFGVEIDKAFSGFSVSSVTSYMDYSTDGVISGTPVNFPATLDTTVTAKVLSEEINLVSSLDGHWRWSAGVFFRDAEELHYQPLRSLPPGPMTLAIIQDQTDTSKSAAVYGEVGRSFLDDELELSFGLRYFHDEETMHVNDLAAFGVTQSDFEATSEALTPRAVVTWKPMPDHTMYASYSEGFRSGFAQLPNVQALFPNYRPAEPDRLQNYEIGSKGSILNGLLAYNAAAFYIDWQDAHQSLVVILPSQIATLAVVNALAVSGPGVTLGLSARPFQGFDFGFNVSWNDLTVDADVLSDTGAVVLKKGDRMNFSPEVTVNVSAQYGFPLGGNGFMGLFALDGNYRSPQTSSSINAGGVRTARSEDLFTAGARFSIESPKNWSATLFADNITNQYDTSNIDLGTMSGEWAPRRRPRTVGLQLDYRY